MNAYIEGMSLSSSVGDYLTYRPDLGPSSLAPSVFKKNEWAQLSTTIFNRAAPTSEQMILVALRNDRFTLPTCGLKQQLKILTIP